MLKKFSDNKDIEENEEKAFVQIFFNKIVKSFKQ